MTFYGECKEQTVLSGEIEGGEDGAPHAITEDTSLCNHCLLSPVSSPKGDNLSAPIPVIGEFRTASET